MEEMSIVIMEKDPENGYLVKELGSYSIESDIDLIDKIFVIPEDGRRIVNIYLTLQGDYEDWEFNAILDNYDTSLYESGILSIEEDEDSYNPTWLVKFEFIEDHESMEEKLDEIMEIHLKESRRVLDTIKDMESEYNQ